MQPEDQRVALHREVANCQSTLSSVACSQEALLLQAGAFSSGGDQFFALGAELRIPFAQSVEAAVFYDAGNLWSVPRWQKCSLRWSRRVRRARRYRWCCACSRGRKAAG